MKHKKKIIAFTTAWILALNLLLTPATANISTIATQYRGVYRLGVTSNYHLALSAAGVSVRLPLHGSYGNESSALTSNMTVLFFNPTGTNNNLSVTYNRYIVYTSTGAHGVWDTYFVQGTHNRSNNPMTIQVRNRNNIVNTYFKQ